MLKSIISLLLISLSLLARPDYFETFVLPQNSFPSNHGAGILHLPDNSILTCWYAGSYEGSKDTKIYCSKFLEASDIWSAPYVAVDRQEKAQGSILKNKSLGNVTLLLDDRNIVWLFYGTIAIGGWSGSTVDYKTSSDFGNTFSSSKRLTTGLGNLPRNKPIKLGFNKIMLPLYHELIKMQGYTCILDLDFGQIIGKSCTDIPRNNFKKHLQPSLIQFDDNNIFAYLRNNNKGNVLLSIYDDKKNIWGEPFAINLPNPGSALDTILTNNSEVLAVYNNSSVDRSILSLGISFDGINFTKLYDLENTPGSSFSYPAIIRVKDRYHLVYTYDNKSTIKYVSFNESWLHNLAIQKDPLP